MSRRVPLYLGKEMKLQSNQSAPPMNHLETIGRISLAHSKAEVFLNYLIELYLGDDTGRVVVNKIRGLEPRKRLLSDLVNNLEKDQAIAEQIDHVLEVFTSCRVNRNIILHSGFVTEKDEGVLEFARASAKSDQPTISIRTSLDELSRLADIYEKVWSRLSVILMYVGQQMGYQVLSGSVQIGLPKDRIPFPPQLRNVDPNELGFREWRLRST